MSWDTIASFLLGAISIVTGVVMVINHIVVAGINSRTLQYSGFGGYLLILVGVIFLIVSYYSLSPFSKIRRFFNKNKKGSRKK